MARQDNRHTGEIGEARAVGVHFEGDLRRRLLDEAAAMIAEVGLAQLSLRAVARRAGVSHAAPAHHFVDRLGLLTAVATEGFNRFSERMTNAVIATDHLDPADALIEMAATYVQFASDNRGYFDVMFDTTVVRGDDAAYTEASDSSFNALLAVIRLYQARGWRPDANDLALATGAWALAHGISVLRMQGSIERQFHDDSLDAVKAIAAAFAYS